MSQIRTGSRAPPIDDVLVRAFRIPTDAPEADGTISWDSTTLVVVEVLAGGRRGLGYTYASKAAAEVVGEKLRDQVLGRDPLDVPRCWELMVRSVRNLGRPGVAAMAISAVDVALWDLKARLLDLPLARLIGQVRSEVPIYGSGGFTSYSIERLQSQLRGWVHAGIPRVKMKIGSHPGDDEARIRAARDAIGPDAQLFVDANGAYTRKQALALAERLPAMGVTWFEEPVSSDDIAGLRLLRDHGPGGLRIAAGEYGYAPVDFIRLLQGEAVDVLQADATRCGGITGFLRASSLAKAFSIPFSAHCAPSLHTVAGCCAEQLESVEYFHDHVRIEQMLFDGAPQPREGCLRPDLSRPGLGIDLKNADAEKFQI